MDAALIHGVLAYGAITIEGSLEDRDFHVKGHLTVDKKGEYLPIITVHDCFACHASFATELQDVAIAGLANNVRALRAVLPLPQHGGKHGVSSNAASERERLFVGNVG